MALIFAGSAKNPDTRGSTSMRRSRSTSGKRVSGTSRDCEIRRDLKAAKSGTGICPLVVADWRLEMKFVMDLMIGSLAVMVSILDVNLSKGGTLVKRTGCVSTPESARRESLACGCDGKADWMELSEAVVPAVDP